MAKDAIMMQEIKSSIAKEKDDFIFLLNLLKSENGAGILPELVKACGESSSLGTAINELNIKLDQARKNVLPELDKLIKLIESNMPGPSLAIAEENTGIIKDDISNNINFE